MATINDKDSGVSVKISSQGSMLVTTGDDGYPTFFTKIYHPRLTSALGTGSMLWAIRAPISKTLILRGGQIWVTIDTTPASITEVSIEMVRFSGADPTGGTLLTPARMRTADATSQTTLIRTATATAGLALPAPGLVDPSTSGFFQLAVPAVAGSSGDIDLEQWTGLELGVGEGLAIYNRGGNAPVGFQTSGWIQFSERD